MKKASNLTGCDERSEVKRTGEKWLHDFSFIKATHIMK